MLLIRDPREPHRQDGQKRNQLVSLDDIYPTIAEMAGIPLPKDVAGKSLVPLLNDPNSDEIHPQGILSTYLPGNHSLRTLQYRCSQYRNGDVELYDMVNDPHQRMNLAEQESHSKIKRELIAEINRRVEGR